MRKLLVLLRMSILQSLEYRGDMLLYSFYWAVAPVVFLAIWLAVNYSGGSTGFSSLDYVRYYTFLLVVQIGTAAWAATFIAQEIYYGRLSHFLILPVPYVQYKLANNLAEKLPKLLFTLPVIVWIWLTFRPEMPTLTLFGWLAFVCSWILAAVLYFLFDLIQGLAAFWVGEVSTLRSIYLIAYQTFAGIFIPFSLLPEGVKKIGIFLPFRYELSFPMEIMMGKISQREIWIGFAWQIFWVVAVILLYRLLWRWGIARYSAVGA